MIMRFVRGALTAACALAVTVALVMSAGAFSESIPTKISLLKWGGNPPTGKLYKLVSKAPNPPPFQIPDPVASDPVGNGGTVTVRVGPDPLNKLECTLSAGAFAGTKGWKALGNPAGSKGYKYINKLAPTNDPCKIVIVKEKVIKVLAKSTGGIDLPGEPGTNPDVKLEMTVGTDDYAAFAWAPHFKERADTLIKMKDQPAPACGDDHVNRPSEECDGAEDSACPGRCIPAAGGGPICGDDAVNGGDECTCAPEDCDGTSDAACPGICQANCRCPEPECGNGVLEAGEQCEPPCSEDAPCGGGTICGVDCTCVPNDPCDCGTPDPTLVEFMPKVETGICGDVKDSGDAVLTELECATSYLGGGILGAFAIKGTGVPLGMSLLNVECCYGTTLALVSTTEAETGSFKTCTSEGCGFGGPVPVIATPAILSICSPDTLYADSFGFIDCLSGEGTIHMPTEGAVHLTGDGLPRRCSDDAPDGDKGRLCTDDSDCAPGTCLWDLPNHCDSNSPNAGVYCTSDVQCAPGTCVDQTHWEPCPICNPDTLKCNGGPNDGMDCTPQGHLVGSGYPTSHDCPPPPGLLVSPTRLPYPLKTQTTVLEADDGQFCGYCRDVEVEGSLCFEGDPDLWTGGGQQSCPDSSIIPDCRPATYHSDPPTGGNPDDIAGCGPLAMIKCDSDADCYAPYETCQQREAGAFDEAGATVITMSGEAAGSLTDHLVHDATLSGAFCVSASLSNADPNGGMPGPGAASFPADLRLRPYSPSGAFLEVTGELMSAPRE